MERLSAAANDSPSVIPITSREYWESAFLEFLMVLTIFIAGFILLPLICFKLLHQIGIILHLRGPNSRNGRYYYSDDVETNANFCDLPPTYSQCMLTLQTQPPPYPQYVTTLTPLNNVLEDPPQPISKLHKRTKTF